MGTRASLRGQEGAGRDATARRDRREPTDAFEHSQPLPQQLIALQRSAGNSAVGRVLQLRSRITHQQQDELLALSLQDAAFRAHEAHGIIEAQKTASEARKRYLSAKADLEIELDEALLLTQHTAAGSGVANAATQFFAAAIALLKLAKRRGWSGKATQRKLSALNVSLQARGYKFPVEEIEEGTTEEPPEPGRRDLVRAAQLSFLAARTELETGGKKLAAERKAGGQPAQLYGSKEGVTYLQAGTREIADVYSLEPDDHRVIVTALIDLAGLALPMIRQDAKLDGASELRDQINAANRMVGLDPIKPFGTATATSRQDAAAERLTALDAKRQTRGPWTEEDTKAQVGAEHEAIEAAGEALGKAKQGGGGHVDVSDVMQRVNADIDRIEAARSLGYTDAVTMLASQALDTPSNVDSFTRSLLGNLIWALSSFIPVVGVLARTTRFAKLIGDGKNADAAMAAATGVFGAMLAQFSSGGPASGGDVSGRLDELKKGLKEANSAFCDSRRAQSYIALSRFMDAEPPRPDDDRAAYLAQLETALRHLLFGEVFAKGLNDGPRPQHAKVEAEAKRQLLVAATMQFAGVTAKGKLEQTTASQDSDYAEKILAAGEKAGSTQYDEFDLVGSRVSIAAQEMGCSVTVDPAAVNERLKAGKSFEIPVSGWSWAGAGISRRAGRTGSFTRWSELHRDNRVWTEPKFTLSTELDGESVKTITVIKLAPGDMTRRTFHGKQIFQLDRVRFAAVGGERFSGMFRGSKPPDSFDMVYSFDER